MIFYTIFDNENTPKSISRELYRLSIDGKIEEGWTEYLWAVIKHPTLELWALVIDEESDIPVIVNRNPNCDSLINYYKSVGEITAQEEASFRSKIYHGNKFKAKDIFPAKTKQRFKNYNQMQTEGWFPVL